MKGRAIFVLVILLFALAVIFFSLQMTAFKAKFLPLACGSCLAVASIFRLLIELKTEDESTGVEPEIQSVPLWQHPFFVAYGWLIAFFLLVCFIGFTVSILIFVAAYIKSKRVGWLKPITISFATSAFVYVVFGYLLRLDIYPGLLYLFFQRYAM
ncbi:tripartite tricarboxylate transporter TctB family protein [Thermodesulfobacteriota bacterium]